MFFVFLFSRDELFYERELSRPGRRRAAGPGDALLGSRRRGRGEGSSAPSEGGARAATTARGAARRGAGAGRGMLACGVC